MTATNTELEGVAVAPLAPGDALTLAFTFVWPSLATGSFSISPAIADGCIAAHEMCDWVENALLIECENERGLFGWLALQDVSVALAPILRPGTTGRARNSDEPSPVAIDSSEAEPATIPEERIEFALDEPREEQVDPGRMTERNEMLFSGWSFSLSGEPVEVSIRVEDMPERVVVPAGFREDVGRVHDGVAHASRSGFAAMVPMPERVGATRCQVEVRTSTTSRIAAEFVLDLPLRPPRVDSDGPGATGPRSAPPQQASPRPRVRAGPPRVAFISHTMNLEGAPRSLFEMARGVVDCGFEGSVVAPIDGPLSDAWVSHGFEKRILPVDIRIGGRDDYAAMIRRLAALMSPLRADLIVANTLESFWAVHVARELGIRSALIVRESENPSTYFHARLPTPIAERGDDALARADRVVFVASRTFRLASRKPRCRPTWMRSSRTGG